MNMETIMNAFRQRTLFLQIFWSWKEYFDELEKDVSDLKEKLEEYSIIEESNLQNEDRSSY